MKSRLIFICIICLLAITTEASAQSFLKKLKQKVNNATREVVNRAKQFVEAVKKAREGK